METWGGGSAMGWYILVNFASRSRDFGEEDIGVAGKANLKSKFSKLMKNFSIKIMFWVVILGRLFAFSKYEL